jgi:TRAP-type C4-dicarboxylate transport system permease small subunit
MARFAAALLAFCAGAVLVALMLVTVVDVVGRYFFNAPLAGVLDLTQIAVVAMVYLGMAWATWCGAHASISVLYDRLPEPVARMLTRLINACSAALFFVIAWRSAVAGIQIREFGQSSQLLLLPLYPLYWVVVVGCTVTALIFLVQTFNPELREPEEA